MNRRLEEHRGKIALLAGRLDGLSPAKKLSQGYSYLMNSDGKTIHSTGQVCVGDEMEIFVSDGIMEAKINQIKEDVSWKKN